MSDHLSTSTFPSQTPETIGAHVGDRESRRLEAVARYAILDTPPDGAFDRITALAAQLFDAPVAICSIIDHERIWFKSAHGLDGVAEVPREPGLCSSAIDGEEPYVVENAALDPRSCRNSLVAGPFGLRFYVGAPLRTADGHNLGTLCVVDRVARDADPLKVAMLDSLAQVVVDELELRLAARRAAFGVPSASDFDASPLALRESPQACVDPLTSFPNRRAFDRDLEDASSLGGTFAVLAIGGEKVVADRRGPWWAEQMIRAFADALRGSFEDDARIYRLSNDEFVVALAQTRPDETVRSSIDGAIRTVRMVGFPEIRCAAGVAATENAGTARAAFRLADARMYAEKIAER